MHIINSELNTEPKMICLCEVIMQKNKAVSGKVFQIEKLLTPLYRILDIQDYGFAANVQERPIQIGTPAGKHYQESS